MEKWEQKAIADWTSYDYFFYYGDGYYCLYCRDENKKADKKYKVIEFDDPVFDGFYEQYPEYEPVKTYEFRFYLRDITGKIPRYQFDCPTYTKFRERLGKYIAKHDDDFMYGNLNVPEYKEGVCPMPRYKGWDSHKPDTGFECTEYNLPAERIYGNKIMFKYGREVEFDRIARLFPLRRTEDDEETEDGPIFM